MYLWRTGGDSLLMDGGRKVQYACIESFTKRKGKKERKKANWRLGGDSLLMDEWKEKKYNMHALRTSKSK